MKKTLAFRKTQIGNMDRNEKLRSYNFQRNMITDHRIEKGARQVSNIVNFLNGELGYDVIDTIRERLEAAHSFKSLDEFLDSSC